MARLLFDPLSPANATWFLAFNLGLLVLAVRRRRRNRRPRQYDARTGTWR